MSIDFNKGYSLVCEWFNTQGMDGSAARLGYEIATKEVVHYDATTKLGTIFDYFVPPGLQEIILPEIQLLRKMDAENTDFKNQIK